MNRSKVHGILLPMLLLICQAIRAQEVSIGDKAPEFNNINVLNYHKPSLSLSDFRGKVVLLDFWNTYCTYCVESFPKLDSLQQLFKDDLQIILVNNESKEKTESFFTRHKAIHKPKLPMIVGDKKLKAVLPSDGQPYIVWIDKQGIVKNFSSGSTISGSNIKSLIQGDKLVFRDPTKQRYGSAVEEEKFEFVSYISHCLESLNVGNGELQEDNNGKSVRIMSNCSSVINLFKKAFGEFEKYDFGSIYGVELYLKDSSFYVNPKNDELIDEWLTKYAYNYELILPIAKKNIAYRIMQQDLLNYFNLDVKIENKLIEGAVLRRADSITVENSIHQKYLQSYSVACPDSVIVFENQSFDKITNFLKGRFSYFFPYVDQTGYKNNISLILRESSLTPFNHIQFQEDIGSAGLTCSWEKIETNVLVISER